MELEVISHLNDAQIRDLLNLYRSAWWTHDRCLFDIRMMLEHTDIVIGLWDREQQKLVGFARVLTDFVYQAMVFDVIVAESDRGQGLGKKLMGEIVNHPSLQQVSKIYLTCLPELIPYYESFNFTADLGNVVLMHKKLVA